MVLREYVDFRYFKRVACSFPFLSHMAFCVISLPGVNLTPASQSAILCFVQSSLHGEECIHFCAKRILNGNEQFLTFAPICKYSKSKLKCKDPLSSSRSCNGTGACCSLLSRWLLSSTICGWKCLAFLSSSSPECLEQIFTQEFKHLSVLGQISVRTYAYSF